MRNIVDDNVPKQKSLEPLFRDTLGWILDMMQDTMPDELCAEAHEHLYRRDGQGNTLCFDSPLRDDLMQRLLPWLEAEALGAAALLRLASVPHEWPGPLHEAIPTPALSPVPVHQPPLFPAGA